MGLNFCFFFRKFLWIDPNVLEFYALLEATNLFPQSVARLISPEFPKILNDQDKCVSFEYYISGEDPGRLEVFNDLLQMYWSSEISKIKLHCSVVY